MSKKDPGVHIALFHRSPQLSLLSTDAKSLFRYIANSHRWFQAAVTMSEAELATAIRADGPGLIQARQELGVERLISFEPPDEMGRIRCRMTQLGARVAQKATPTVRRRPKR